MNIVERLRGWASVTLLRERRRDQLEAADTIEAMAEALKNLMAKVECGTALNCELCEAARAALRRVEESK